MLLNSTFILPHLKERMRHGTRDASRHVLCPSCKIRTRLYRLSDGRRKCQACSRKFAVHNESDARKLKQYADILLCFCLDFTAHRASQLSRYRYNLVSDTYAQFRKLLAAQSLMPGKIRLITNLEPSCTGTTGEYCKRCGSAATCKGRQVGDAPVYGVRELKSGQVFLEPLENEPKEAEKASVAFSGFICNGSFHRFTDQPKRNDGMENFWSWVEERLRKHHGVFAENTGYYLKELEWKYNHRHLTPDAQAKQLVEFFPSDFLSTWSKKRGSLT